MGQKVKWLSYDVSSPFQGKYWMRGLLKICHNVKWAWLGENVCFRILHPVKVQISLCLLTVSTMSCIDRKMSWISSCLHADNEVSDHCLDAQTDLSLS